MTVEKSLSNCFARMVNTAYKKRCILHFYLKGYKAPTIQKFLAAENLVHSCDGIAKFIKVLECTWFIYRQVGLGRPSKVTREVKHLVEQQVFREVKLEINIPLQQFSAKSKGGYIRRGCKFE